MSGYRFLNLLWRLTALVSLQFWIQASHAADARPTERYEYRAEHDPNGLGKFYKDREIALVMGHEGADWLERPEREAEEQPDLLMESLKLKVGDCAADIGAGTGYLTRRLA